MNKEDKYDVESNRVYVLSASKAVVLVVIVVHSDDGCGESCSDSFVSGVTSGCHAGDTIFIDGDSGGYRFVLRAQGLPISITIK